jgi:hypothetical protein
MMEKCSASVLPTVLFAFGRLPNLIDNPCYGNVAADAAFLLLRRTKRHGSGIIDIQAGEYGMEPTYGRFDETFFGNLCRLVPTFR